MEKFIIPRRLAGAFVALSTLTGCVVGPDFFSPKAPALGGYTAGPVDGPRRDAEEPQQSIVVSRITGDWWDLFRSERLSTVLQQAVEENRSLAAAKARLAAALETVEQAGGARYPQIGVTGGAARRSRNFASSGLDGRGPTANLFSTGLDLSYAVDLFGGIARSIERQEALAEFEGHQAKAAYLTLTGSAVAQSIQIALLRAQLKVAEEIVRQGERNVRSVQTLLRLQEATRIDLESAEAQLAIDRTAIPPLKQQLSAARHALAVLVGKAPIEWAAPDFDLDEFTLPATLPLSVPSELVRQRPDILAAEAQLHAASASVGVATAQLYPNITLSASTLQQALTSTNLFTGASNLGSLAANLTAPIFNGGALQAQKRASEEAFRAQLFAYQQTVLTSFAQVADLLQALSHDAELVEYQRRAVVSTERSVAATRSSFAAGEARFIQVLDAERLYNQARLGYLRATAQRYLDTSQFLVAMGGGWWSAASAAPQEAAAPTRY